MRLLPLLVLRHLRTKVSRTVLTTAGVALGVALTTAIDLINDSTLESFRNDVQAVSGKAGLTISAGEAGFPEQVLESLEDHEGIETLAPMIEARVWTRDPESGRTESLLILGVDMLREKGVRMYSAEGGDPGTQEILDNPLEFLNSPESVILTHVYAKAKNLRIGSELEVSSSTGSRKLVVKGLISPEGPAAAFGGSVGIMDIDAARMVFGREGRLDRIDIVPEEGTDPDALGEIISRELGAGYDVLRPETKQQSLAAMVASFQTVLRFMGSLALLVGLFMVVNSVTISVAERRGEIGTLRSLGASRGHILAMFTGEGLAIGLVGSALGLGAGRLMAESLLGPVSDTLSTQFVTQIGVQEVAFGWRHVAVTMVFGTLTAVCAAFWPSYQATRIDPIQAVKRTKLGAEGELMGPIRRALPWVGAGMLGALALGSFLRVGDRFPSLSKAVDAFNSFCAIGGSALVAPGIVLGVLAVTRPTWSRRRDTVSRLSADNLLRMPKRTGGNVTTLLVGLLLVIIIATVNRSFKTTITSWIGRVLNTDLIVSSKGDVVAFRTQPLDESLGKELARVPGVDATEQEPPRTLRFVRVRYDGKLLGLKAISPPTNPADPEGVDVKDRPAAEAVRELFDLKRPSVLVSENFVLRYGKRTGDLITLETPSGPLELRISGIVTDFANPFGVFYMPRELYVSRWRDPLVNIFAIKVKPGHEVEEVRREIDRRFGPERGIVVTVNAAVRRQLEQAVDRSFAMTRSIEFAALLVALLGLMNTLLISVMERMRELGMLRAIGMSGSQLARMVMTEALLQGTLSAVAAAALGGYISFFWMADSLSAVLGWVVQFHFPWDSVGMTLVTGLVVALVAGLLPARKAARLEIRDALSYE